MNGYLGKEGPNENLNELKQELDVDFHKVRGDAHTQGMNGGEGLGGGAGRGTLLSSHIEGAQFRFHHIKAIL